MYGQIKWIWVNKGKRKERRRRWGGGEGKTRFQPDYLYICRFLYTDIILCVCLCVYIQNCKQSIATSMWKTRATSTTEIPIGEAPVNFINRPVHKLTGTSLGSVASCTKFRVYSRPEAYIRVPRRVKSSNSIFLPSRRFNDDSLMSKVIHGIIRANESPTVSELFSWFLK